MDVGVGAGCMSFLRFGTWDAWTSKHGWTDGEFGARRPCCMLCICYMVWYGMVFGKLSGSSLGSQPLFFFSVLLDINVCIYGICNFVGAKDPGITIYPLFAFFLFLSPLAVTVSVEIMMCEKRGAMS